MIYKGRRKKNVSFEGIAKQMGIFRLKIKQIIFI